MFASLEGSYVTVREVGVTTKAWYVSNVSIILIVPCYYITPFGCLWALFLHIYIIFGTNLLTGGPAHIAILLPVSVFRRKGISNGVQTEWNLWDRNFWNERDPEDLECKSRSNRGGQEIGGRVHPLWACPLSPGPHRRPPTYFFLLYIPTYPENIQEHHETQFPPL